MDNRAYTRVLLAGCILGILYLSLYPFSFTAGAKESISWRGPQLDSDWVDMVSNFLFYLPLGFLITLLLHQKGASVLVATLLGATLSLGVELVQMYLPQRDSNLRDLACNAAGTLAGGLGALAARRIWPNPAIPWPPPLASGLTILWVGWQMYPFFPLLRRPKLHELKAQLPLWTFHPIEFGDIFFAAFLLYAFATESWQKRLAAGWTVATVLAGALLAQSLIMGISFSNARLTAAALGLIVAILVWRPERRLAWIALPTVLCGWIAFRAWNPLHMPRAAGSLSQDQNIRSLAATAFLALALAGSCRQAFKRL